jgi:hypothetical protein
MRERRYHSYHSKGFRHYYKTKKRKRKPKTDEPAETHNAVDSGAAPVSHIYFDVENTPPTVTVDPTVTLMVDVTTVQDNGYMTTGACKETIGRRIYYI